MSEASMKHVADVLALVGGLALIAAGFTVTVTVGLAVLGVLAVLAAVLLARVAQPEVKAEPNGGA